MKNKKLLAILLAVFSSFAVTTTTLAACSSDDEEPTGTHEHTYGAWEVTKVPTETETGTATRSCSDGDSTQTVTLPSLSDASVTYVITNITATETEDGTALYTITIDGETYSFTTTYAATGSSSGDEGGGTETATVSSVTISGDQTVTVGNTITLTAAVVMSDSSTYSGDITWTSSDTSVATVSGGVVTAVSAGTATITATAGDKSATYSITVSAASSGDEGGEEQGGETEYEEVTTYADIVSAIATAGTSTKTTEDLTIGKFTFSTGLYFEASQSTLPADEGNTTYGIINNQEKAIYFTVSGTTNSVSFDMRGASSSGCVMTLYKEDGTAVYTWDSLANSTVMSDCVVSDLEAGTYYLQSKGSARIANLAVTEMLEVSETVGISASAGSVDFLANRSISASDLALNITLNYENGRKDSITSGYTTDIATAVDTTKSGTYTVTVTYGEYTAEVDVNIYAIDSITLSDHVLNSSRETISLQKVYLLNASSLNTSGLAVTATAKCGTLEEEFVLTTSEYTISSPDLTTAGTQTVTVTASEKQASYEINVLSLSENVDKTTVNVDASATTVGEDSTSHIVTVKTINDALKLFELYDVEDSATKTINVAAGTYNEKVYIDMPNVTLVGANTGLNTNETVIVYDAMNGITDPSGTTSYSTDGSATVTISANATNFTAKNITFKNYYNTHALYQEALTITSGTQAVACLVRGDMAYFENVTFTSYHDTLYAYEGRQVYNNCYIEGRTDYIFGDDATAYFYKCTIHSIGAGTSEKNGGYIVATKGGTSSAHVTYGYIFNECTFEGDENVQAGSVSVARGWDSYMTIMVMNSTFDESFSLEGYGYTTSSLNDRYTKMNAEPVASQLYEYNNTGVGAITVQEVEGVYTVGTYDSDGNFTALSGYVIGTLTTTSTSTTFTASTDGTGIVYQTVSDDNGEVTYYPLFTVLSASEVANYSDYSVIFATTNGGVKYDTEWAGTNEGYIVTIYSGETALATINVKTGATLTTSAIEEAVSAILLESNLEVDGIYTDSACTTAYTDGTISATTSLYITTKAYDSTITVTTTIDLSAYDGETIQGTTGEYKGITIDASASGAKFAYNSAGCVQVNAGTILTIKYSGTATVTVNCYSGYSDTSTHTIENGVITLTFESQTYVTSITVTISDGDQGETSTTYAIGETIDLSTTTSDEAYFEGGSGTYLNMTIDATNGKFRGNSNSVQVNATTIITINSVATATAEVEWYSGCEGTYTVSTDSDGVITLTITGSGYITAIKIVEDTTSVATVSEVTITGSATELTVDDTLTLTAAVTMVDDNTVFTGTIEWSSSDESVANVSNGVVTAVAAGEVTITATADGVKGTYTITVKAASETSTYTDITSGDEAGASASWQYWNDQWGSGSSVTVDSAKYIQNEDGTYTVVYSITSAEGSNCSYGFQLFYNDQTNYTIGKSYTLTATITSDVAATITINGTEYTLEAGVAQEVSVAFTYSYDGTYSGMSLLDLQHAISGASTANVTISNIKWTETTSGGDSGESGETSTYTAMTNGGETNATSGWYYWNDQWWCGSSVSASEVKYVENEDGTYTAIYSITSAENSSCDFGFQLFYNDTTNYTIGKTYTLTATITSDVDATIKVNGTTYNLTAGTAQDITVEFTYSYDSTNSDDPGMSLFDMQHAISGVITANVTISNIKWTETTSGGESGDSGDQGETEAAAVTFEFVESYSDHYFYLTATSTYDLTTASYVTVNGTKAIFYENPSTGTNTYAFKVYVGDLTLSEYVFNWYDADDNLVATGTYTPSTSGGESGDSGETSSTPVVTLTYTGDDGNTWMYFTATSEYDISTGKYDYVSVNGTQYDSKGVANEDGTYTVSIYVGSLTETSYTFKWYYAGDVVATGTYTPSTSGGESGDSGDAGETEAAAVTFEFVESYSDHYFYLTATSTYDLTTASYVTVNGTKAIFYENPSTGTNTYAFKVYVGDLTLSEYVFNWYDADDNLVATGTYTPSASGSEDTTTTYTIAYTATTDTSAQFSSAYTSTASEETSSVTVDYSALETCKDSNAKSTEDGKVSYAYAWEIKQSKPVAVTVAEGATDVTITIYVSHTTKNTTRNVYISTAAGTTSTDTVAIEGTDSSPQYLYTITATLTAGTTYYIWSDNTTHLYGFTITYTI